MLKHSADATKRNVMLTVSEGQLVNRAWLQARGFSRPDIDYYLRVGHLQTASRGLYRRAGEKLKWQHIVYSLREMGYIVHVGGKTALSESGLAHYVEMSGQDVQLFSAMPLPNWLIDWHECHASDFRFISHRLSWLENVDNNLLNQQLFGGWDWKIAMAQPELAVVEWISLAKTEADLQAIDAVFEGLNTLRPKRVQTALTICNSIQTKRLFAWFSTRHRHAWLKQVDFSQVNMGNGKRSFIKGGVLNKQWQITVPKQMEQRKVGDWFESEQSLF